MADIVTTEVPRDIRKYKTNILGPFSIRQSICVGITIIVDVVILMIVQNKFSFETFQPLVWVYIFIDLPILLFMFDIQGVPMERYLIQILQYNFLLPPKRKNSMILVDRKKMYIDKKEKKAIKKKINSLMSSHPEYKSYQ